MTHQTARKGDLALLVGVGSGWPQYNGQQVDVLTDPYEEWCFACRRLHLSNDIRTPDGCHFICETRFLIPLRDPGDDQATKLEQERAHVLVRELERA